MIMCNFWCGLFSAIYSFESSIYDFWILVVFGVLFWGNLWVQEIFENDFGMKMCDFGVYLMKFIHFRAPYMIFGFCWFWVSFFGVIFGFQKFSKMFLEFEGVTLGGLFSEIYLFESSLYDFWDLVIFGSPFWGKFCIFLIFENGFGMRMYDFGGSIQ